MNEKTYLIKCSSAGGFANKLFGWEYAYSLAALNGMGVVCDWPVLEHITLPNTMRIDRMPYPEQTIKIDGRTIPPPYLLEKEKHYELTCGFDFPRVFEQGYADAGKRPISEMELRDQKLDATISRFMNMTPFVVGVHIRKGDYINTGGRFVAQCPFRVPDAWYFRMMSAVRKAVPGVVFYLASDGTKEELQPYYDNFPCTDNRIFSDEFTKAGQGKTHHAARKEDMADLFALASTKLLICSVSTFSMVAYSMYDIPVLWPEAELQTLQTIKRHRDSPRQVLVDIETLK